MSRGGLTNRKSEIQNQMSSQPLNDAILQNGGGICSSLVSALNRSQKAPWVRMILQHRAWLIGLLQALLIFSSLLTAWLLRFNFFLPDRALLFSAAPVLIAIRLCALGQCGLLRGWWRYTDLDDVVALVRAIAIGSAAFVLCIRLLLGIVAFPRTIYVLEPLLSILFLAGVRLFSRIVTESFQVEAVESKDVILIGAGVAAEMTLRAIANPESGYRAIGCVDDDSSKTGGKIHGVPILGAVDALTALVEKHGIKEVLIAAPSATGDQMQRFVEVCRKSNVK